MCPLDRKLILALSAALAAGVASLTAAASAATATPGLVPIEVDGAELVYFQAKPLEDPTGGPKFQGSDFIHPLKTPSGFVVTESQPGDHPHHFGLWWPWKFAQQEGGKRALYWELQRGQGRIETRAHERIPGGLIAESVYLDRTGSGEPTVALNETTRIQASPTVAVGRANGYVLHIAINQTVAGDAPVTINQYRYSGFALRGASAWNRNTSHILTSEGADRDAANFTQARWVRVEGEAGEGRTAGVLMMSHPENHNHPEKLRTWDKQHDGMIFINFNTVADASWVLQPEQTYQRQYGLFVYDGTLADTEAEYLWQRYAQP